MCMLLRRVRVSRPLIFCSFFCLSLNGPTSDETLAYWPMLFFIPRKRNLFEGSFGSTLENSSRAVPPLDTAYLCFQRRARVPRGEVTRRRLPGRAPGSEAWRTLLRSPFWPPRGTTGPKTITSGQAQDVPYRHRKMIGEVYLEWETPPLPRLNKATSATDAHQSG